MRKRLLFTLFAILFCSTTFGQKPNWEAPNSGAFQGNMTVSAYFKIYGEEQFNQNIEFAAFCGNELRGVGSKPVEVTLDGEKHYLSVMTVHGNANDIIKFKIWDPVLEEVLGTLEEKNFYLNDVVGPIAMDFYQEYWDFTRDVNEIPESMTIISQIAIDDNVVIRPNLEVAAFHGDELRGIGRYDEIDNNMIFFTIYGNDKETENITFKLYDHNDGTLITESDYSKPFKVDDVLGDYFNPEIINFITAPYVAQIGEDKYFTLQAAFAAAQAGETVELISNVTEEFTINNTANVIFDMKGFTLTGAIKPSTANLTVEGGTITNNNSSISAIEITAGTLNLEGVNITSARHAIRIDGAVTANIKGGEYSLIPTANMTHHAINVSGAADVTIEGGTFVGPAGTASDSGSAVNVQSGATVAISGGDFSGGKNNTLSSAGTLTLTGGTYDQDPAAYCATGYAALKKDVNKYQVKKLNAEVAYRAYVRDEATYEAVAVDLKDVVAGSSLKIELYSGSELLTTTTYAKEFPIDAAEFTCLIVLDGAADEYWNTTIETAELTVNNVPTTIKVYANDQLVNTYANALGAGTNEDETEDYKALDCVLDTPVAKVGNTEYYNINNAIANWANNTTLTLLADVTLSDVITLKSTEHHILNLSTYTMTAAAGKNAIEITPEGAGTAAKQCLTINADVNTPGGITATAKSCIYYKKTNGINDRLMVTINGGVFNGAYSINSSSNNGGQACPYYLINGGTFNGNVNLTKAMLKTTGGIFNGWVNCTGDSTAHRLIAGGTFKTWQFMTADAPNKFAVGTNKQTYDLGVYIDDNGYLVVGGPVITEAGTTFEASSKTTINEYTSQYNNYYYYLKYSSAKDNGIYYTSVEKALADNKEENSEVNIYVNTLNLTGTSYKGTLVITKPLTVTFPEGTTPAWTVASGEEGHEVGYTESVENGVVTRVYTLFTPVAQVGETYYATLQEAINATTSENTTVKVLKDITLEQTATIAAGKEVVLDLNGKTINAGWEDQSAGKHIYAFKNEGTLTLTNGIVNTRGIYNYGTLTVNADATVNSIDANGGYGVDNKGILNVYGTIATTKEDGDAPGTGTDATPINNEANATVNVYEGSVINNVSNFTSALSNSGTANIKGGTFTSVHTTVINHGTMTIDGGSFTCNGLEGITAHALWAAAGTTTINGGTFDGKDNYNGFNVDASSGASVEIKGGTFLSCHSGSLYGDGTIAVSGGKFFDPVPEGRCAEGYIPTTNADGTYGVKPGSYVAQIGDVKYETLAAALDAAQDGETVELIPADGVVVDMIGEVTGNKKVIISGTATVNWGAGWLFVGRGNNPGDGVLEFRDANITSVGTNPGGTGIHVSAKQKDEPNKNDGKLFFENSKVELDYLVNRGTVMLNEDTELVVNYGFGVSGRPANETVDGKVGKAFLHLQFNSKLTVNRIAETMGIGYEGIGSMTVYTEAVFKCNDNLTIYADSQLTADDNAKILVADDKIINFEEGAKNFLICENSVIKANVNGDVDMYKVNFDENTVLSANNINFISRFFNTKPCVNNINNAVISANMNVGYYTIVNVLENTVLDNASYDAVVTGELNVEKTATLKVKSFSIGSESVMKLNGTVESGEVATSEGYKIYMNDVNATFTTPTSNLTIETEIADSKVVYQDGKYKVVAKVYIAQIGDVKYETLAAAFAAAQAGETVELISNVTEEFAISNTANVTFDMKGFTLTGAIKPSTANLTVKDGTITNNNSSISAIEITAGTLNLEGVNITSARHAIRIDGAVTANISGGEYTLIPTANMTHHAINVSGAANVTIEGGTFVGPAGTASDSGSAVNVQSGATVAISGGDFSGGKNNTLSAAGTLTLTGGTYDQDPAAYCATGYAAVKTADKLWKVYQLQNIAELKDGWNWFSSYINISGTEGMKSLQNALGTNGVQIKNNNKFTNYTSGIWDGSLKEVSVKEMYMINVTTDQVLQLAGDVVDPSVNSITLAHGWNWIGYQLNQALSVANVGFVPVEGDRIKSHVGFSQYYTDYDGWWGTLNTMTPGIGYMYYNAGEAKTLTYSYPTGSKSELKANVTSENNYWAPMSSRYANNMNMIAIVEGNKGADFEVAAFVNGEVRGSARPIYVEPLDAYMLFLTIHGEGVEEMTFQYYDLATGEEYTLGNRMNYSDNAFVGTMDEPYVLTLGTTGIGEASMREFNVYPNPTTIGKEVSLGATCETVEVFNVLGVKMAEYHNVDTIDAFEAAGVYVIRVTNDNLIKHCRLVVK